MAMWADLILGRELARWRRAGRQATFWWRDDDGRAPTPALERLLRLCDRRQIPLTLAVIPDGGRWALGAMVGERPLVRVAQHGLDHENRREPGHLGDIPLDWPDEEVARRVAAGWRRIADLPGAIPVYVPPWNDLTPGLPRTLAELGYRAMSSAKGHASCDGPPRIDADVDILNWRGGARFKGWRRLLEEIRADLVERRLAGFAGEPIGFNTHHLAHDEAAWRFLDRFFTWSREEPALRWASLETLLAEAEAEAEAEAAPPASAAAE